MLLIVSVSLSCLSKSSLDSHVVIYKQHDKITIVVSYSLVNGDNLMYYSPAYYTRLIQSCKRVIVIICAC